jgi:hypothetical protein
LLFEYNNYHVAKKSFCQKEIKQKVDIRSMKEYQHFISLGYFCSVASELERIGLRSCSSPFDWCISDWKGVEDAINNNFVNFLDYDTLRQSSIEHSIYQNEYKIIFFHDFNKYDSLKKQLKVVQEKYERRIKRFYKNITEPTLFIRYISNENGRDEIDYLEINHDKIIQNLRRYNKNNDILFIANSEIKSCIIEVYQVDKDINDSVARRPLDKNKELYELLNSFIYADRDNNLKKFQEKEEMKKHYLYKFTGIISNHYNKTFRREYVHDKQY